MAPHDRLGRLRSVRERLDGDLADLAMVGATSHDLIDALGASARSALDELARCVGDGEPNDLERHLVARISTLAADLDRRLRAELARSGGTDVGRGRRSSR